MSQLRKLYYLQHFQRKEVKFKSQEKVINAATFSSQLLRVIFFHGIILLVHIDSISLSLFFFANMNNRFVSYDLSVA